MKNKRLILSSELLESLSEYCKQNYILPDDLISVAIGQNHSQPFLLKKEMISGSTKTERMLKILEALWIEAPEDFEKASNGIGGHKRLWFSKNRNEISDSGNSNSSEQIGDSPWYVSTNCPTQGMVARVEKVMTKMGFSWNYTLMVAWSIHDEKGRIYKRDYIEEAN